MMPSHGSIDSAALTAHRVHQYGAFVQARLAARLRALGVQVGLDGEAVVALAIPESAVTTFSKRDRHVIGDAKRYASEHAMDWDELSVERKKHLLHEASAAGRLGKTKERRIGTAGAGARHRLDPEDRPRHGGAR
jgi:hypothetical protein